VEEMCGEAGVKFHLHTRLSAAYREGSRLRTVVSESKSGRQAWQAPVFIDASGDGDLGALAGCAWDIGQGGAECPCQPLTLNALAMVRDADALSQFISFYHVDPADRKGKWTRHRQATTAFLAEIRRAGIDPSYGMPTLFQVRDNLLMVMANHEYGVKAFDADAITEATVRARAEVFKIGDVKFRPYDIPLRALIAKDVDGLMMAGRCISGDFLAHASYRVTGDSVATGEAAGAVAALAAKGRRMPHEVPWNEAGELLRKMRQGT